MKQTGFGVTEEMMQRGVRIEDLVEKACPFYERMDTMFSEQANVDPVSQLHQPDLSDDKNPNRAGTANDEERCLEGTNLSETEEREFDFRIIVIT